MIKKIIKHYAYCDGCRKPFKMRGSQSVEKLSELEQKLEMNGWTVINNIGVFCPSCIRKFQKKHILKTRKLIFESIPVSPHSGDLVHNFNYDRRNG